MFLSTRTGGVLAAQPAAVFGTLAASPKFLKMLTISFCTDVELVEQFEQLTAQENDFLEQSFWPSYIVFHNNNRMQCGYLFKPVFICQIQF